MSDANSHSLEAEGEPEAIKAQRQAKHRALGLLARREYGAAELTSKLIAKGVDRDLASLVVDRLSSQGLQSDARFTESYTHNRVNKGYGPIQIRQALIRRGVPDRFIAEHLDHPASYWRTKAREALARRFREVQVDQQDAKRWGTHARFLERRGFPADLIYQVLDNP